MFRQTASYVDRICAAPVQAPTKYETGLLLAADEVIE
jgi:hypothetical protein